MECGLTDVSASSLRTSVWNCSRVWRPAWSRQSVSRGWAGARDPLNIYYLQHPRDIYIIYNTPLISTQVPGGVRPLPRPPPRPPRQPGAGAAAGEVMSPPGSPGGGSAALPPRPGPGTHTPEAGLQGWGQVIPLYLDMSLIHEVWNPIARYKNI